MKIAVPVNKDRETIFKRTGRAPLFAIYEDNKFIDIIVNNHAKSHNDEHGNKNHNHHEEYSKEEVEHHKQDIQELRGYDVILAQAVGKNMAEALDSIGLDIQKISKIDGVTAQEVVDKFINNQLKRQN